MSNPWGNFREFYGKPKIVIDPDWLMQPCSGQVHVQIVMPQDVERVAHQLRTVTPEDLNADHVEPLPRWTLLDLLHSPGREGEEK